MEEDAVADFPPVASVEDVGHRVTRGGSFVIPSSYVRSGIRSVSRPDNRNNSYGFRPARTYNLFPFILKKKV